MSNPRKKPPETGTWGQFFRFVLKAKLCWPLIVISLIFSLVSSDLQAMIPGVTGELYAGSFETSLLYKLIWTTLMMVGLSAVGSIVHTFAQIKSHKNLRKVLWKKMMRMDASSETAQSANTMLSAITIDAQTSADYILNFIIGVPSSLLILYELYATANELNPKLMWALLLLIPLYIFYAIFIGRWQEKANHRIQMRIGGLTGFLSERIRNLNIIKAYTNEGLEEQNGIQTTQELYKAKLQPIYIEGFTSCYIWFAELLGELLSIFWASYLLRNGEITSEAWMTFFLMIMMITNQFLSLCSTWADLKAMRGYAARVSRILDTPDEVDGTQSADASGDIMFNGVSYSYGTKNALDNVSFTIPRGKMTAIVGPSGSGKSTALNLIERIYTPASGKITAGGKDVSDMKLADYRAKLAYVQQDTGMFSGTIREAMTYGITRTVSQSELESVAATSGILSDIQAIPGGFDGKVAAWGESLSGGQRQKLVVARELLRNAEVLLLDEPTSALDANTAASIHNTLTDHFAGKTIVTVTHDLRLIAKADQIVVMDGGHVAGCGGHEELMNTCPLYRELVEEQSYQEVYQK